MPNSVIDAEVQTLCARWATDPVRVALTTTTARNASALTPGVTYKVLCDVDCYIKQGNSAVNAVVATSNFLPSRSWIHMAVVTAGVDDYVAGIVASGTGTLYIVDTR